MIFGEKKFYYPCLVGSDGTPRRRKFLTLDQKIEIIECHEAGMRIAAIARERGMPESSVRTIVKRQDQIKELVGRSSHLSPNTVVRKRYIVVITGSPRIVWKMGPTANAKDSEVIKKYAEFGSFT